MLTHSRAEIAIEKTLHSKKRQGEKRAIASQVPLLLFLSPTSTSSFEKKNSNKMAPRPVLKTAFLGLLLCASAALMLTGSSNFAYAATSKRAKRAKAEAAVAAAPSAADTILSALNVKTLIADEPNARLTELGDLSDSEDTRTRLYLSPSHQKAAALIKKWMTGAGLEVTTDAVGNVRGRINGNGTTAVSSSSKAKTSNKSKVPKRWITGSHFDVVPDGGEFFLLLFFIFKEREEERERESEKKTSSFSQPFFSTQPQTHPPKTPGAFDGALGIVLSIAAVEATVAEAAVAKGLITNRQLSKALASGKRVADLVPRRDIEGSLLSKGIEVIAFADQEGARFGVPMASSKAVVGTYESEGLLKGVDSRGKTVAQALKEADPRGEFSSFADSAIRADEVEGYVEAHIEQYDKLERIGSPVGIVTAVAGTTVMHVSVRSGDEKATVLAMSHAASVPMAARGDPVPAVAEAVLALEKRCKEDAKGAPHGVLCGVHFVTLDPNSPLNIPSGANFTVTVASTSDSSRRLVVDNIVKDLDEICKKRKLACQVRCCWW
jgi:acetylornithine deacetylase/succinyl-diaminopimelate desuccinylase-like protein